eukprot:27776-Pleurochrysis_carterae.AAC.1
MVELEGGLHQGDCQLQMSTFAGAEPAGRLEERVQLHQVPEQQDVPWRPHRHWPRPDPLASGVRGWA